MKKYWSKRAANLVPYTAGEQPKMDRIIKLNTNENAYPPSPKALETLKSDFSLRKYPAPNADELRKAAAKVNGVEEKNIFCSNGSDEGIALCFYAFFDEDKEVAVADVTYSFYSVWADFFNIKLKVVPLLKNYALDAKNMKASGGVIFPNPNAPTGMAIELCDIEKILQANSDSVVIVDEAYVAFGAQTALPLLEKYDNLLIVRTFSKSHSLAGMRIGYIIGSENLISCLYAVKDSFNSYPVDSIAQKLGAAALLDGEYYKNTSKKIISTREKTVKALEEMGVEVLPSKANFIFVKCGKNTKAVFEKLRERAIIVRWFDKERTREYLRVTIGTDYEMETFVKALGEILKEVEE